MIKKSVVLRRGALCKQKHIKTSDNFLKIVVCFSNLKIAADKIPILKTGC
ncbi:Uncharacterised protein [Raoultella terrigena]|uniref:Uncharacterized protein n=1 Tax=Raoultella terrigena TaxID=577 RepID=A0A3P8J7G3_RAOTE|nr:Uncharacterised protein [Raoultella terrigena]